MHCVQAASDNLGELPPGFAVSKGQLQPGVRQGPLQDAPDFLQGYHAGQAAQDLPAGTKCATILMFSTEHICLIHTAATFQLYCGACGHHVYSLIAAPLMGMGLQLYLAVVACSGMGICFGPSCLQLYLAVSIFVGALANP